MADKRVSRAEFDRVYNTHILGREFVEDIAYYRLSSERFWRCLKKIESLRLESGSRALDIGGGIMAILLGHLLGFKSCVGDITPRSQDDVEAAGVDFLELDLLKDQPAPHQTFDLIVLQEVIEHIPQPPYLVFERLRKLVRAGGFVFVTTPNGHRFRNLLYMVAGKEILGHYKYAEPGELLGHQQEYTMKQLCWQVARSGLETVSADYYEDGFKGATPPKRIAHMLAKPASLVPHWQNGLMIVARAPAALTG